MDDPVRILGAALLLVSCLSLAWVGFVRLVRDGYFQ